MANHPFNPYIKREGPQAPPRVRVEDIITLQQAADYAERHIETLRHAVQYKLLWAFQPGREWLTTRDAVDTYLAAHGNDERSQKLKAFYQQ